MSKSEARVWWIVAIGIAAVHFLTVMVLGVYILRCDDLNQSSSLEPALEVLLTPAHFFAIRFQAFRDLQTPLLFLNSFIWGGLMAFPFCWFFLPPWQFSLSKLLIATTLVALVLGLGVWLTC